MKIQAVIFDWAGTVVDYGSVAPIRVLQSVFERHGVPISTDEARRHMGLLKRDHISKTFEIDRVREAWTAVHRSAPDDRTVTELYAEFIPLQLEILPQFSTLIPGVAPTIERLRARGIKIGGTTGYTRPMVEILLEKAEAQGYSPDAAVCPDDVGAGRPYPWMIYENAIRLKAHPLWAIVKVGDTPSDIQEGTNAGVWTVGVAMTGNMIGMTEQEWAGLPEDEKYWQIVRARQLMNAAGAHYVIDTVAEIDVVLDRIEDRLANGDRP